MFIVGDLHQPLHSADNNDVGGNNVTVTVWQESNLHKVGLSVINEAELSDDNFTVPLTAS